MGDKSMTQLTLRLPEYVLQNARKRGLLDSHTLTAVLRNHLEYRKNHPELKNNATDMTCTEFENLMRAEVVAVTSLIRQGG